MMYTDGAQCTAQLRVTPTRAGNTYLGYAAHCAGTGSSTDTNGCQTDSRPARHPGRPHQRRQPRQRGHRSSATARSPTAPGSPSTSSARPTPTPAPTTTSPWSRSTPATSRKVNPSVPFWGGPTGIDTDGTAAGDRVWTYGNSSLRAGLSPLSPHTGVSLGDDAADGGWSHPLYTVTPGIPGDSGSGFMTAGRQGDRRALDARPGPAPGVEQHRRPGQGARLRPGPLRDRRAAAGHGTEPFDPIL